MAYILETLVFYLLFNPRTVLMYTEEYVMEGVMDQKVIIFTIGEIYEVKSIVILID